MFKKVLRRKWMGKFHSENETKNQIEWIDIFNDTNKFFWKVVLNLREKVHNWNDICKWLDFLKILNHLLVFKPFLSNFLSQLIFFYNIFIFHNWSFWRRCCVFISTFIHWLSSWTSWSTFFRSIFCWRKYFCEFLKLLFCSQLFAEYYGLFLSYWIVIKMYFIKMKRNKGNFSGVLAFWRYVSYPLSLVGMLFIMFCLVIDLFVYVLVY